MKLNDYQNACQAYVQYGRTYRHAKTDRQVDRQQGKHTVDRPNALERKEMEIEVKMGQVIMRQVRTSGGEARPEQIPLDRVTC